jgi:hypothetical protein
VSIAPAALAAAPLHGLAVNPVSPASPPRASGQLASTGCSNLPAHRLPAPSPAALAAGRRPLTCQTEY